MPWFKKINFKCNKRKPNYLALGSFFKSKLKPNAKKAKKDLIIWTKKRTSLPLVAIGGIDNKNFKKFIKIWSKLSCNIKFYLE